ncbi:MAG: hypothetical protein JNL82_27650 [Myxococcales bacterium]|nr:hypothetical protein [Myxococcales bacterium]
MALVYGGLVVALAGAPAPAEPAPGSVEARYGVGLPARAPGASAAAPATTATASSGTTSPGTTSAATGAPTTSAGSGATTPTPATTSEAPRRWQLNPPDRWYALRLGVEVGFVGVVFHRLQFGREATYFDLRNRGGQDVLFPFFRFQAEWEVKKRHTFSFLIQPIKLRTTETLRDDLVVDDRRFVAGTPMAFKYDFGFYRLGYAYDFFKDPEQELSLGLAVQLRNATIDYAARDGSLLSSHRNVGVVPLIKLRGRWTPRKGRGVWLGGEIDGIYVRGRIISGTRDYFEGALMDTSVRVGFHVPRAGDAYVNVRYIGGGARGAESEPEVGDGFTDNWFHTVALSLGLLIR